MLPVAGYWSLLFYKEAHDEAAIREINKIIPILDAYRQQKGTYPGRLERVPEIQTIDENEFLLFSAPDLWYAADADGYRIYFYHWPLGPFSGYDSKSRDWYAEE